MAHISTRSELPGETYELTQAVLRCGLGKPTAVVAQAALDLALGLWAASDVTREMALKVVASQIENLFRERSN